MVCGGLVDDDTQDPTPPHPFQPKRPSMVQLSKSSTAGGSSESDMFSGRREREAEGTGGVDGERTNDYGADESTNETDDDVTDTVPKSAAVRAFVAGYQLYLNTDDVPAFADQGVSPALVNDEEIEA